jgi:hypothetical protein
MMSLSRVMMVDLVRCNVFYKRRLVRMTMCDDYMVGKFTWKMNGSTKEQLIEFVRLQTHS